MNSAVFFNMLPDHGEVIETSPDGNYIKVNHDSLQIIAVNCFNDTAWYQNHFKNYSLESVSFLPTENPRLYGRFVSIILTLKLKNHAKANSTNG